MKIKSNRHRTLVNNIWLLLGLLVVILLIPSLTELLNNDPTFDENVTSLHPFDAGLPQIELRVDERHYAKLKEKRDQSLGKEDRPGAGILLTSDDDLVPATLQYEGQPYPARIRLKGDWTQHLLGDTWSFRVKLEGEQTIQGMRKFSLQHPQTRNYAGEWLFHQILKEEGILYLRYDFINIALTVVNDLEEKTTQLGVYAIEEFFDKRLIEHNRRREGVILKIDEDPLWRERRAAMANNIKLADLNYFKLAEVENMNVLPFGKKRVLADSSLYDQFLKARHLFRSYIDGKKSISEVFDVPKLARFNAICNLLGANHALIHHNYRVYYNPINAKLEPIGFDADAIQKNYYFQSYLHAQNDPNYMEAYMAALERVTSDDYFDRVMNWPGLEAIIKKMKEAFPKYEFKKEHLISNREVLRSFLYPVKSLNVFLEKADEQSLTLSIDNYNLYPAEIIQLTTIHNRPFGVPPRRIVIPAKGRERVVFSLDPNYQRLFVSKKKNKTQFDLRQDVEKIKVLYKTPGTNNTLTENILEWPPQDKSIAETGVFERDWNVTGYDFLEIDSVAKTITCRPGRWEIGSLRIGPGFTFIVAAGTELELMSAHGSIVSLSPVQLLGTAEAPVRIFTQTHAKGLLVLNARDTSIVRYCKFERLSTCSTMGWSVSGAVNFYDSPVVLYNSSFTENRSEDALNIISSWFEMDNVVFTDIHADAFDGDFVEGTIRNSFFDQIGNDAIDVSGSRIQVDNVLISRVGDKGLSAGEESQLTAEKVVVKNSEIAIAVKDRSVLTLENTLLENNQLAFTAFQKKPEFGPARIVADSVQLSQNQLDHLVEHGSSLQLNGQKTVTESRVLERMYGTEFGRKSE